MTALGYVEVDWSGRRWAAVSPTITLLPAAGGYGLVVGSRTARLTSDLIDGVDDPEVLGAGRPRSGMPLMRTLWLPTQRRRSSDWQSSSGLPFVHSVSERLGGVLPSLDAMLTSTQRAGCRGITTAWHASTSTPASSRSDQDERPGLYRYEIAGPRRMQFRPDNDSCYPPSISLSGRGLRPRRSGDTNLIWWEPDGTNGTLLAPWRLPLPATSRARSSALQRTSSLRAARRQHCLRQRAKVVSG